MSNADRAETFPSRRVALATQYLVKVVDQDCGVRDGTTSLYWDLVSVIHKHAKSAPAVIDAGIRLDEPAAPGQPAAETGEKPRCTCGSASSWIGDHADSCGLVQSLSSPPASTGPGGPLADEARRIAAEELRDLRREHEKIAAELRDHRAKAKGEYWCWQGDGEDHLESLTCPVVIRAESLRKIVLAAAGRDAEEQPK